ncbi:MAG: glycosyltransferase family 2 protein [Candidatus Andersenbacteria bacterium]
MTAATSTAPKHHQATPVERAWEILPGALEWTTFALLLILSWQAPLLMSYAMILYSLYWLIKSTHVSFHLVWTFRDLRRAARIDWLGALRERELRTHDAADDTHLDWRDVWHLVVLPTYNEPVEVLQHSINALTRSRYPLDRVMVLVCIEERAGAAGQEKAAALRKEFGQAFAGFWTVTHPDGRVGEAKVKSANARYGLLQTVPELERRGINLDHVVVSNFDSDTQATPDYFAVLTDAFVAEPQRLRRSYQPIPLYHNNFWHVPMLARVSAIGSSFWQMIEASRPHRLVSFSSHAIPLRAVLDVGGWDPTRISEDSRIYWQCYVHYNGDFAVIPLPVTVTMDCVRDRTWPRTLRALYKQKQRWAYGAENLVLVGTKMLGRDHIKAPFGKRLLNVTRMVEGLYSWGTAAVVLALGGWLPTLLGGPVFRSTVLGQNFSSVSRFLLTLALVGVAVSIAISARMLPPRPPDVPRRRLVGFFVQWLFTPFVTIIFGSIPAVDAHTRLMLGRYMEFFVAPKVRATSHPASRAGAAPSAANA